MSLQVKLTVILSVLVVILMIFGPEIRGERRVPHRLAPQEKLIKDIKQHNASKTDWRSLMGGGISNEPATPAKEMPKQPVLPKKEANNPDPSSTIAQPETEKPAPKPQETDSYYPPPPLD